MNGKQFVWRERLKSLKYAFNGLKWLLKHEHNTRIHVAAACMVSVAGIIFRIDKAEWLSVVLCIGMVLAAEIFNTVAERLADFISPGRNEKIKIIKDIAAAGVLVTALTACITGGVIFLPRIFALTGI